MVFIDLHAHSHMSDGTDTVLELFQRGRALGLSAIALTDHDTVSHWAMAEEAAVETGLVFIRGTEISTRENGISRHLLAYDFDPTFAPLADVLERAGGGRVTRANEMLTAFANHGIIIDEDLLWQDVQEGKAPGRAHFGSVLVAQGLATSIQDAFDRLLGPGKPIDVQRYNPTLTESISLVAQAGGKTVLAHPMGRQRTLTFDALQNLVEVGLSAIEVDHQEHDEDTRDLLRSWANELEIPFTGGSDYHGTRKQNHELGVNVTTLANLEILLPEVCS